MALCVHVMTGENTCWYSATASKVCVTRPEIPSEQQLVTVKWGRLWGLSLYTSEIHFLLNKMSCCHCYIYKWQKSWWKFDFGAVLFKHHKSCESRRELFCPFFLQIESKDVRFSSLTFDDSGMYQCIATNHHGVIYATAELHVFGESNFKYNCNSNGSARHFKVTFPAE